MSRVILHCDMNNFFASVETLLNPSLADKCIAVCGSKEERRGIVLAKNEAAKKCGVATAEPIWQAQRKCPSLVVVSPHFEYYSYFSERARDIYLRFTDLVEPFGIDECWLDVTGSVRLFGKGEKIANEIRNSVRNELGLTISVGVSFNKIFAKLGSDMKKPDAVTVIDEKDFKKKVFSLSASELIGVGKSAKEKLHRMGVDTIGELAELPREVIVRRLGKQGDALWHYANGLDNSPVSRFDYEPPAKSISRGTTTKYDLENNEQVKKLIYELSISVAYQLRKNKMLAGGVQVSVRNDELIIRDFQRALSSDTDNALIISNEAFQLFIDKYDWQSNVHSLTVRVINLVDDGMPVQLNMFFDDEACFKTRLIDKTVDKINEKYGKYSIKPLVLLD